MVDAVKGIKGMLDILPTQVAAWQYVEAKIRKLMAGYNYTEIRMPVVERTALFKRSIGEVTDIVEKEMYTFSDRNDESITMRPEGTAGCVRACIEHSLLRNQQQHKLWYMGPMYRYERPQKGRYRQFFQLGVETFNIADPDIDAEQIALASRLWKELGIAEHITLEINSLGSDQSRAKYREELVKYFTANIAVLDEDSKRRLETNPLRILDSKNPDMQDLNNNAPHLLDSLDEDSKVHFEQFKAHLSALGINYKINTRLVRGLDYYNRTVYEWVTDKLGSQSAVCSGGRFDNLVESLAGPATPAVGFAIGLERLLLLIEEVGALQSSEEIDGYLICLGDAAQKQSILLAEKIRDQIPGIALHTHLGAGNLKNQLQKADKFGAKVALIVGDDELAAKTITVKYLRSDKEQIVAKMDEISKVQL